ncbi:hypothetical protein ACIQYG_20915 [Peribacillus sp. NPDC096622]|uniref:hypothetical protein n=1 Tax=Peribacillus sp. NPDC096622 TaxID=3364396 RepID=UPI003812340A
MTIHNLIVSLQAIVDNLNINVNIVLTDDDSVVMIFYPKENQIKVNLKSLEYSCEIYNLSLEVYSRIILYHELGHVLDPELEELENVITSSFNLLIKNGFNEILLEMIKENRILAEKNAWRIAESFIEKDLYDVFVNIKQDSLEEAMEIEELNKRKIILMYEMAEVEGYIEVLKQHSKN